MRYPTREEILELSPEDRLRLIDDLWDTLEGEADALPVSEEHKRILDDRLEALRRDPESCSDWEEAKRRILGD